MAVLNDFEACGYGVPALQSQDLLVLNDVPARNKVSPLQHQRCMTLTEYSIARSQDTLGLGISA